MNFDITHGGCTTLAVDYAGALDLGYPAAIAGAALKGAAKLQVAEFADAYRAKLATRSAGKLAEYRIKEEIARSPDTASAAELDLLSREAEARGTNRAALLADISAKAAAYRQIALLIGALEAEAGAAITAIPDEAQDIETQIGAVLAEAKAEAETEYQSAVALLSGT